MTMNTYAVSRFQNLVWNGTHSAHLQFASDLRLRPMVWLTLKNWTLMILTLGLYWPFATIAMTRLRLLAVRVHSTVSPCQDGGQRPRCQRTSRGDASGDFLGFDIGL